MAKEKYYGISSKTDTGNKVYAVIIFSAAEFEYDAEAEVDTAVQSTIEVLGSMVFPYDRSPVSDEEIHADALKSISLLRTDLQIHEA